MPVETAARETPGEDAALMRRVQLGDEAALGLLMERWELAVKAVVARIVLNTSEAEDLAQETFVRVWLQRARFRSGADFRPWVFSIAINLARNRLRWWRRRPVVEYHEWSNSGADAEGNDGGGPKRLEAQERAVAVRDAIASLPVDLREAIVLSEFEQMSQAEIAAAVGTTVKAVETRIYRAREKLRTALKQWA